MANSISTPSVTLPEGVRLERPEDEAFLFAVYADSREEELRLTGWDETARRAFLEFQFKAQRYGYRNAFPNAAFLVVLEGSERAGRMVVNRTNEEIHLVDIAFLASFQRRGIGSRMLRILIAEARETHRPLRVDVFNGNTTREFYARLGFVQTGDKGAYSLWEWRSESNKTTP